METCIGQLMEFVKSLETKDGLLKRSVLEGLEAMMESTECFDLKPAKWVFIRDLEAGKISFGHDGMNVPIDDDGKKVLLEKGERAPVYIKKLDSLFFGDSLIVSPYGMITLHDKLKSLAVDGEAADMQVILRNSMGDTYLFFKKGKVEFVATASGGEEPEAGNLKSKFLGKGC
jgi:hypothetical protein